MKKLLIGVLLLLTCTTLYGQTFKVDKIWSKNLSFTADTLATASDTLSFVTGVTPVGADSVAVMFGNAIDSVSIEVLFRPTLPDHEVSLTGPVDTLLQVASYEKTNFSNAIQLPANKLYGKFYIKVIYSGTLVKKSQPFTLWLVRRYK